MILSLNVEHLLGVVPLGDGWHLHELPLGGHYVHKLTHNGESVHRLTYDGECVHESVWDGGSVYDLALQTSIA